MIEAWTFCWLLGAALLWPAAAGAQESAQQGPPPSPLTARAIQEFNQGDKRAACADAQAALAQDPPTARPWASPR